jgi:thiol-disulfide isomerase/thioredoxin
MMRYKMINFRTLTRACATVVLLLSSVAVNAQMGKQANNLKADSAQLYSGKTGKWVSERSKLSKEFGQVADDDSVQKRKIIASIDKLNTKIDAKERQFIADHPDRDFSAQLLLDKNDSVFETLYAGLTDKVKTGLFKDELNSRVKDISDRRMTDKNRTEMEQNGMMVPDFTMLDSNGDTIRLSELLRHSPVVLDYWGTWCSWCVRGLPKMRQYQEMYSDKVTFVSIDCHESEQRWRNFLKKEPMPWIQVRNGEGEEDLAVKYGVRTFPTKIIIGKDRHIISYTEGEAQSFYDCLDSLFAPRLPQSYQADSLQDYVFWKLMQDSVKAEDYPKALLKTIDREVPSEEWAERLKANIFTGLMEQMESEDPKPYLDLYLADSHTDSLQQKVKAAYKASVQKNGALYPGKPAPDFQFTDTKGRTLSLANLKGKVLLIDIWGTWCVPCIQEMPYLDSLQQRYQANPEVHIMSVACDKKADRWKNFLAKHPTSWHQYLITPQGDKVLDNVYHVIGIPRFIVVDRNGKLVSSDALRPSDPEFNEFFEKIVRDK